MRRGFLFATYGSAGIDARRVVGSRTTVQCSSRFSTGGPVIPSSTRAWLPEFDRPRWLGACHQRACHSSTRAWPPELAERLADYVTALRRRADLSQRELAALAGVPASTVARLESGATTDPRLSTMAKLAAAAGHRLVIADDDDELLHARARATRPLSRPSRPAPASAPRCRARGGGLVAAMVAAEARRVTLHPQPAPSRRGESGACETWSSDIWSTDLADLIRPRRYRSGIE